VFGIRTICMLTLSLDNVSRLFEARWLMSEEKMDRGHWL